MASIVLVEMGEIRLSRSAEEQLQACGLGACVGLCLYEAAARIAVLVHVVLPAALPPSPFASRQLPAPAARQMRRYRHCPCACRDCPAGGPRRTGAGSARRRRANLHGPGSRTKTARSRLEIGTRNVLALQEGLIREGIALCAEDTGGHFGRTVTLDAGTGDVRVRPVGLGEYPLVTLGKTPHARPTRRARGFLRMDADVRLDALVRQVRDLPALPAAVLRVMQTADDPKASASDVARALGV